MFRLLRIFATADGFGKESTFYEWAEYNLPAATDMVLLHGGNELHVVGKVIDEDVDAVTITL